MRILRLFAIILTFAGALALPGAALASDSVNIAAILAEKPPKRLSEFGLFEDIAAQRPAKGVTPYTLRTALFSDHANKYRFVFVPSGSMAQYREHEVFEFPVGTALIKTFAYPADLSKPEADVTLIETRLLVRRQDGWTGWAYLWDAEKNDGILKKAGARLDVTFRDFAGANRKISYKVPNVNQCKNCHSLNNEFVPIGPKARNLNFPVDATGHTQLDEWFEAAIVEPAPTPPPPPVADWQDENEPLEARARAYLDVNCAHCHRKGGSASNSGLFLTHGEENRVAYGIGKRPVAAGRGSGGFEFAIEPGHPERSILIYRMKSRDPGVMMPELGRALADDAAITMLSEWIRAFHP